MKNPETEEIDKDIDSLLEIYQLLIKGLLKNPPGGASTYKATIEFKLKKLYNQKVSNLAKTEEDFKVLMDQIRKGKKVEQEHDVSEIEAIKIALDHLEEDPKYYTKLKKMEESLSFSDYYNLVLALEQETLGLVEPIKIEGIDTELVALIDSGNAAYNVLHGVDIEDRGSEVEFITTNNVRVVRPKVDEITIHVGAGHDEHRPVVEFTIEIGNKVYPDVKFSIGDRTENQHPVLIGADFLKQVNALIDVSKE